MKNKSLLLNAAIVLLIVACVVSLPFYGLGYHELGTIIFYSVACPAILFFIVDVLSANSHSNSTVGEKRVEPLNKTNYHLGYYDGLGLTTHSETTPELKDYPSYQKGYSDALTGRKNIIGS